MWRCVDFESPIGGDRAKTCYRNDDLLILVCGFCWCGGRIFTEKSRIGSLELLSVDFSRFQSVSVGFSRFQSVSVGFSCLFRFRDTSVFRGFFFVLFSFVWKAERIRNGRVERPAYKQVLWMLMAHTRNHSVSALGNTSTCIVNRWRIRGSGDQQKHLAGAFLSVGCIGDAVEWLMVSVGFSAKPNW